MSCDIFSVVKSVFNFFILYLAWHWLLFFSRCPSITVSRTRHNESTSNLKCHVHQCMPANSVKAKQLSVFVQGLTYHPATHHMKVALWVARHHCPFAIIKDPELLNIFHDLNNKCTTPSASTVSRDIKEIFQLTHKNVAQMLQVRSLFPFSYLVLMTVRLTEANYISALTAGHHLKQYHFLGLPFTGSQVAMSLPSF